MDEEVYGWNQKGDVLVIVDLVGSLVCETPSPKQVVPYSEG